MSASGLDGKVALITGGGSGVGAEIARSLSALGVHTMLAGRRDDRLRSVSAELVTPGATFACDLTAPGSAESLVEATVERFDRLDVVVHSAGTFEKRPIQASDDDFLHRILEVNLSTAVSVTRVAWSHLCDSTGQVVLISSAAALRGFPDNTAYAASKGAMNAVGEVLREEGRPHGIRVLTLCPAQIDTELWDEIAPDSVRARMMRVHGVGDLVAALVATDRSIDFGPVSIQPPTNPWMEAD